MITGLRSVSFDNLVLNEGAFIMNFKPSDYATYAALVEALEAELGVSSTNILGATSGGGTFVCAPETRTIGIDGLRGLLKGATQIDSWDVRLTGTLKEIRPDVFAKLCIGGSVDSSVSGIKKITVHSDIQNSDYMADMCWVGSTSKGMMLIHLTDVLNTSGVTMTFQDKGEATIPFEFVAHNQSATGDANVPCEVFFLEDPSASLGSITVTSVAGSSSGKTALTASGYTLGSGESYKYKVGDSSTAPAVAYGDVLTTGWTSWNGSSELTLTTGDNGKKITVAAVDSNNGAVAAGNTTLVVKTS